MGVLVDVPNCIGCRKCEFACRQAAGFDGPPLESFEDKSPMVSPRRPSPESYTVINQYPAAPGSLEPVYVKANCLHCNEPACVSACLVGAFEKRADGPVVYDPHKCMGCRYCMVACPFQIPTYDYDVPLTPQVRKCNLCAHLVPDEQPVPACVKICPRECLIHGRRSDLIELAHEKIRAHPDRYVNHVYGEHEVGGTSWLYVAPRAFDELGFPNLPDDAPTHRTEIVQHGLFKFFMPPLALFGLLGLIMSMTRRERGEGGAVERDKTDRPATIAQAQANGSEEEASS
jgi:Fe-S-cluster-containing dehydrogenase component